tara:strand:- start:221 stop:679 length:459 start_codon:yes stop_codon:yes gene_type:complete
MAELPVEKMLLSEVLQKVSNAKTKKEKVVLLRKYSTPALRSILIFNYDESVVSMVPSGDVPYTKNDSPPGTEHTILFHEYKKLYHFVKGGNDGLAKTKREQMFIQILEGLHMDEANVLCLAKDKKLGKRYKVTKACISEAFPEIEWGNRGGK